MRVAGVDPCPTVHTVLSAISPVHGQPSSCGEYAVSKSRIDAGIVPKFRFFLDVAHGIVGNPIAKNSIFKDLTWWPVTQSFSGSDGIEIKKPARRMTAVYSQN
jgi:hypothetical protein